MKLSDNLRDLIFGMEDGLVSNLGLVLGLYTGGATSSTITLAGLVAMASGAFSMSVGSYLSSKNQSKLIEEKVKEKLFDDEKHFNRFKIELTKKFSELGFSKDEIKKVLTKSNSSNLLSFEKKFLTGKFGVENPNENSLLMFFSFIFGAFIPIIPFFFGKNVNLMLISGLSTALTLFFLGYFVTSYNGQNPYRNGFEVMLAGLGAGLVGYILGILI